MLLRLPAGADPLPHPLVPGRLRAGGPGELQSDVGRRGYIPLPCSRAARRRLCPHVLLSQTKSNPPQALTYYYNNADNRKVNTMLRVALQLVGLGAAYARCEGGGYWGAWWAAESGSTLPGSQCSRQGCEALCPAPLGVCSPAVGRSRPPAANPAPAGPLPPCHAPAHRCTRPVRRSRWACWAPSWRRCCGTRAPWAPPWPPPSITCSSWLPRRRRRRPRQQQQARQQAGARRSSRRRRQSARRRWASGRRRRRSAR